MSTTKFFQRLTKLYEPVGRVQFVVFEKIYKCLFIQIAQEKSGDYVLMIYMKKYEIASHNYVDAKRAHQVKK